MSHLIYYSLSKLDISVPEVLVPEGNIEFPGEVMANDDSKCGAAVIVSSPPRHTHGRVA